MATFQTRDDPMVNCPYNKAHRVSRSRIQSHILKCRKTHQDRQLETCPFNAQHRIEKELKHDHIMNCPDRAAVDREIAMSANDDEDNKFKGNASVPPYHSINQHVLTENWDNEISDDCVPGYDPSQAKKNGIFPDMSLTGLKPAERKKYYKEMHNRGNNNEESQMDVKKEEVVTKPKGLRQPRAQPEALQQQQQKKEAQVMCNIGMGRGAPLQNRRIAANIYGRGTVDPDSQSSNQVQGNNFSPTGGEAFLGIARGRGVSWTRAGAGEIMFPGQILGGMTQQSPVLGLGRGILASQYAPGAVPGQAVDFPPLPPGEVDDVPQTS